MASPFPASNVVPSKGYVRAKEIAHTLDLKVQEWLGMLAGDVTADDVWSWYREMYWDYQALLEIATIEGIEAYAIAQEVDPELDIVAAWNAMLAAISAAYLWLYAAIPRDVNGYLLTHKSTVAGELTPRVFTPAETAPFIPLLQAIDAAIS
jgi:hypothetical protein